MTQSSQAAESPSPPVVLEFLSSDELQLRERLIKVLQRRQLSTEAVIELAKPYDPDTLQKVIPTIIDRYIEKKSKDKERESVIREAIQNLESQHHWKFHWNERLSAFVKGHTFKPERIKESDLAVVKRIFGTDYREALDLGELTHPDKGELSDSKLRHLAPLARLMDRLNYDLASVKSYIFQIRLNRLKGNERVQGVKKTVTGADLAKAVAGISKLVWTPSTRKRPRESAAESQTSRKKQAREFL